ncbi:hypothetical protein Vadar_022705 [Vaccinium darrowii]|uniref:Uncharacterized protein n=1 Tax=Vaccinium darrowii TaxID=229202 RepID=A0ACB7YHG7_9ERIC|nr:hypothetical protein Vadar_022705 [Vaccinium darrowii]
MTSSTSSLSHAQPYSGTDSIIIGNGSQLVISHIGHAVLPTPTKSLSLNGVLCVPSIKKNLLSIRHFSQDNNCYFEMDSYGFRVKDNKTGQILVTEVALRVYIISMPIHLFLAS